MFEEQKPTQARFPSWCNVIDDNVVVSDEKLPHEKVTHFSFSLTVQCFKNES